MLTRKTSPILSVCPREKFAGREQEISELIRLANAKGVRKGLSLLAEPGAGTSELLKQTFDSLFLDSKDAIPVYFSFKDQGHSPAEIAGRFFHELLLQMVAFRRREAKLLRSGLTIDEIVHKAPSNDAAVIAGLVRYFGEPTGDADGEYFARSFTAPIRAAAAGFPVFVMLDDVHELDGRQFETLRRIFSASNIPFVFAGARRYLFAAANWRSLPLERLAITDAARVVETFAADYHVAINDETRDLVAVQFDRDLSLIDLFVRAAADRGRGLNSFQRVEQHYAEEVLGGLIARRFGSIIERIVPNGEAQKNVLGLLHDAVEFPDRQTSVDFWSKRSGFIDAETESVLSRFNAVEFLRVSSARVEGRADNLPLRDYLIGRFRLEIAGESRASVFGRSVVDYIKRAPRLMAGLYRKSSAIGVREILSGFDGATVPKALIDYGAFASEFKGAPETEILSDIQNSDDRVRLPNIVFAAHTAALYEPIGQVAELERSAVGFGFRDGKFIDESETVWIAAEIDSKLEASREHTEFWCDRLEMAALMCDFVNPRIWLIAPEGFSGDALDALNSRNAFGSSRRQVELLKKYLRSADQARESDAQEIEIVVPMDDDAELIAAHTVEEIAKRHNFSAKAINQIKTALIEASINAAEHSLSPDRKIHQKLKIDDHGLTVTITNRGMRLTDKTPGNKSLEGRRGWGLELMRRLMDEVTIEETDDGTRISMTKYQESAK